MPCLIYGNWITDSSSKRPKCLKVARELIQAGKSVAVGKLLFSLLCNLKDYCSHRLDHELIFMTIQTTQTPLKKCEPTG